MPQRVDIHCHLLPGVDDGPSTIPEAIMLAKALVRQGFTEVIATPHYIDDYSAVYRERIQQQYAALQSALGAAEIPLKLHLGGEIMLTSQVLQQADEGTLPVLAQTNYVLLELPLRQEVLAYAAQAIFHLQIKGYQTILAHPERVEFIKQDPHCLGRLLEAGVLLQVNVGSLFGDYGKRAKQTAEFLLAKQMVHFLATDSHQPDQAEHLQRLKGSIYPLAQLLGDNPRNLLAGRPVEQAGAVAKRSYFDRLLKFTGMI